MLQEGNAMQFNSPIRGNFNPRGGFIGRGFGGGMDRGRGQIICYNCAQLGHLARDCQNTCTTCSYCNSFEHVIEYCLALLAKLQERRGGNQKVQLISVEPHGENPKLVFITRGGVVTREDRVTPGKNTEESGVRKVAEKTQEFDPKREKQIFEEARKEFGRDRDSSSKTQPEVRECGMPLEFDQSASPREGKEVSKLMEFFCTCINLIKDERVVEELQNFIRQYELVKVDTLLSRVVHQVSKKIRTNKELHLNAPIGYYDIDYVVLDLGSEVMS
jgi:hypothetical protein